MRENLTITLLLDDDVETPQADTLALRLQMEPYVRNATVISSEQALNE